MGSISSKNLCKVYSDDQFDEQLKQAKERAKKIYNYRIKNYNPSENSVINYSDLKKNNSYIS